MALALRQLNPSIKRDHKVVFLSTKCSLQTLSLPKGFHFLLSAVTLFKSFIHASLFSKFLLILGNIYSRNAGSHPQSFFRNPVCISHGFFLKYLIFLLLLKQLTIAKFAGQITKCLTSFNSLL